MGSGGDRSQTEVAHVCVGRWSDEEKAHFVRGLELYGPGRWGLVAQIVGTRTTEQVRSHAKKHFRRLRRQAARRAAAATAEVEVENEGAGVGADVADAGNGGSVDNAAAAHTDAV